MSQSLLTDAYHLTMVYAFWKQQMHQQRARYEVFFRTNPFKGEFTVFAGLEDCLHFVKNFRFSKSDLDVVREQLPDDADPAFFEYIQQLNCEAVTLQAIPEGSIVFPRVPLIIVEGPLAVCQILETHLLNLVGFASLVATNATRFRLAAGDKVELLEFGLRRAQGPNGGLTASKYSFVGGFDGTSNMLAGKLFGIPVKGTMAHSFVTTFKDGPLKKPMLARADGSQEVNLQNLAEQKLEELLNEFDWGGISRADVNRGELAAFCAYAVAHPNALLVLHDTFNTLGSGLPNFCAVALALNELGYRALGCRIDSGVLAYLSKQIRRRFEQLARKYGLDWLAKMRIVASNDINEDTIRSLNVQGHCCDVFGVGTHLVTCQKQPALGCVYKQVDVEGEPKMKLSEEPDKLNIPGRKKAFRLYNEAGVALLDLMTMYDEPEPQPGQEVLCRHPFVANKRAIVVPDRVEELHRVYWSQNRIQLELPSLNEIREYMGHSLASLRTDHIRPLKPTPYKVSLLPRLFDDFNKILLRLAPTGRQLTTHSHIRPYVIVGISIVFASSVFVWWKYK